MLSGPVLQRSSITVTTYHSLLRYGTSQKWLFCCSGRRVSAGGGPTVAGRSNASLNGHARARVCCHAYTSRNRMIIDGFLRLFNADSVRIKGGTQ